MKRLLAWLNLTCPTCGAFKLPKAEECFDCTQEAARLAWEEWRDTIAKH